MKIVSLTVSNYKSLRNVAMAPGDLSVVIGANAAGKTNLADLYHFLADLYQHGLPVAVARKGGYENIAHRKMRRSRGAIDIQIQVEFDKRAMRKVSPLFGRIMSGLRVTHSFSLCTEGQSIKSEFMIEREQVLLERKIDECWQKYVNILREGDKILRLNLPKVEESEQSGYEERVALQFQFLEELQEMVASDFFSKSELFMSVTARFVPVFGRIASLLSSIRVFQISPTTSREFGVPIPNPEMDRYGGNLPAVVDMLLQKQPDAWASIMGIMKQILPNLEKIEVDYTHARTLGLYFYESGVGRAWTVEEISDGTIHSLALLVALFDPRTVMLILEEPENSVHTWILRALIHAVKEATQKKQILLTTHSRVVVDLVDPGEVWVMWREFGESHLDLMTNLDPDVNSLVSDGELSIFELIDSGLLPQVSPPAPRRR